MRRAAPLLLLAGCNAIFGLDPTSLGGDAGRDATSPDAVPADAFPPELTGVISAFSDLHQSGGAGVLAFNTTAAFGHAAPTCSAPVYAGECLAHLCVAPAETGPFPDAGQIDIVGTIGTSMIPNPDGTYPDSSGATGLFGDDQILSVSATGNQVPMFMANPVAPTAVTFQQSDLPASGVAVNLVRQDGIDLTWASVPGGIVTFIAVGSDQTVIECDFPSERGSGKVQPTTLLELPAGAGYVQAAVIANEDIDDAPYRIRLRIAAVARRADGDWVNGPVNLQ